MTIAPDISFQEAGIVLATMANGVQLLYFLGVVLLNLLGLYIADHEADRAEAAKTKVGVMAGTDATGTNIIPAGKDYVFEWQELIPYAGASAILTMAILETMEVTFWASLFWAFLMGLGFRPLLPEITKAINAKASATFQAIFGKYG